jgi:hypothetical protein
VLKAGCVLLALALLATTVQVQSVPLIVQAAK